MHVLVVFRQSLNACCALLRFGAAPYPTTIGQRLATDLPVLNSSNTKILTSHASFERICGLSGPRSYQKTDCWRVHRDQERDCRYVKSARIHARGIVARG